MSIIHVIKLAIDNKKNYSIIRHPIFNVVMRENKEACKCHRKITDKEVFHYTFLKIMKLKEYKEIFNNYVIIKGKNHNISYDVCFHIRGGDVFTDMTNPSPYVPLPLTFYKKYIEIYKDKNICIVHEDDKNPVVNILKKEYPNINFQSSDLISDIYTLANCEIFIPSTGTFFLTPFCISNKIKKIIYPEYLDRWFNTSDWGVEAEKIKFPNYIKSEEWLSNCKKKLDLVLNYEYSIV